MIGLKLKDGFIDLSKIDFYCPHCGKIHTDNKDYYLDRCEKNKSGIARVKCECGKTFYMTYDITGDAVSFLKQTP